MLFRIRDLSDLPTLEDFKESALEDQVQSDQTTLPFDELTGNDVEEMVDTVSESERQPKDSNDVNSSNGS